MTSTHISLHTHHHLDELFHIHTDQYREHFHLQMFFVPEGQIAWIFPKMLVTMFYIQ